MLTKEQEKRFWAKVKKGKGCWTWTGAIQSSGYGCFKLSSRKTYLAHRVSCAIAYGRFPRRGLVVMHLCDNPKCVNPGHLREGSPLDNVIDMWAKGRRKAKLTKEKAAKIKETRGSLAGLAERFGVSQKTIRNIKRGRAWKSA